MRRAGEEKSEPYSPACGGGENTHTHTHDKATTNAEDTHIKAITNILTCATAALEEVERTVCAAAHACQTKMTFYRMIHG